LKTSVGIAFCLLVVIVLLVLTFESSAYSQEEIEWCDTNRPLLSMEICAEEFGY
jgi:hypothetical protein